MSDGNFAESAVSADYEHLSYGFAVSHVPGIDTAVEKPRRKYSKAPGGKRTKTGCITCRQRRVKCTEEKPACQNCVKAKRVCAGYAQEFKFKDPVIHDGLPWSSGQISFPVVPPSTQLKTRDCVLDDPPLSTATVDLAYEPLVYHGHSSINLPQRDQALSDSERVLTSDRNNGARIDQAVPNDSSRIPHGTPSIGGQPSHLFRDHNNAPYDSLLATDTGPGWDPRMPCALESQDVSRPLLSKQGPEAAWTSHKHPISFTSEMRPDSREYETSGNKDDRYRSRANDASSIMATRNTQDNLRPRSYRAFVKTPDMLSTYTPSHSASLLQDTEIARIFCHFINVTGPSMSMFERCSADSSLTMEGKRIPKKRQHIWTYTLPAMAIHNEVLLQAMLAISSLHIARLQNESLMPSLKHYAFALRRIAKAVGLPQKRSEPATLAAAILLAYYEIWTADHAKWMNHLLGATQLVKDIDFSNVLNSIATSRESARDSRQEERTFYEQQHMATGDVDSKLVAILMGKRIEDGITRDTGRGHYFSSHFQAQTPTSKDIDVFEIQSDLWWCYAKQDAYQSILGGGSLLIPYDSWDRCPPRAPLGRVSELFGTFDHLVLLLGRLGEFIAKDAKRKRQAMKANGGIWLPPGVVLPVNEGGKATTTTAVPPTMPDFNGMMPGITEPTLPMGFESRSEASSYPPSHGISQEPQEALLVAEREWQDLHAALTLFEVSLNDDFQPMSSDYCTDVYTPFGPALQYRTFGVAGIWLNYYMALIACHRAHPSMPPAAMMAAGVAAGRTAFFANQLGRIAGGIAPDCHTRFEVAPAVGAALIESAATLFVGSIQLQEAEQRDWVIRRMLDIARLTGFQTALAIASGCEAAWVKRAEAGRGPPYSRVTHHSAYADVTHVRRIDRTFEAMGDGSKIVVKENHRAQFALGLLGMADDFQRLDLQEDHE